MLELVARHGAMDLELIARGDLDVDQHHTVEDAGIALGEAVLKALGSKRGIFRAGYFLMPMDETLASAAIDLSGRPHCVVRCKFSARRVGDFQTELVEDFFGGFAQAAKANVHLRLIYGRSSHHQVEADIQSIRARVAIRGVRAIGNSSEFCLRRKACCESRAGRIRGGKLAFGGAGARSLGRRIRPCGESFRIGRARTPSFFPASGTSAR